MMGKNQILCFFGLDIIMCDHFHYCDLLLIESR